MKTRKLLLAAIAVTTLAGVAPAFADVDFWVNSAPPEPRHEVMPAPRHGYVWEPGFYDYRHGHYRWVPGHWERERRGMYYHPSHWVHRDGRWTLERGRWDRERYVENEHRDRDHDGVPNRFDRDRDGDGVPNGLDRAPNNPYRH
jgi:WXXGXW repeat (2 copies)